MRSRAEKKCLIESLQHFVSALESENAKLRAAVKENLGTPADELLAAYSQPTV